ncbi:hypothetical protein BSZ39_09945 [Bowdeniella nasicola]|uniref:Uncharacterized protein n=1 Tax=Bowdeniella nasicola TaxID=208480 RepID=A0A1Q5Q0E8_9ACTO|nr:hypothetical protein BSZ39_09945 [Bowdeniella nasicola]
MTPTHAKAIDEPSLKYGNHRPDEDAAHALQVLRRAVVAQQDLARAGHVESGAALGAEDLEREAVGVPERDARDGERAHRAVDELGVEGRDVVVFYYLGRLRGDGQATVAGDALLCGRALLDDGREPAAGYGADRAADEIGDVDEVRADIPECAGARGAAVAPGDRCHRVQAVIGQVPCSGVTAFSSRLGF